MSNSKPSSKGANSKTVRSAAEEFSLEESPFSIGQLIRGTYKYRFPLQLVSIVTVSLYLLFCLIAVLKYPPLKISSVPFHLNFKGAEEGLYPNGLTFSSEEIIADLVLAEVHKRNSLEKHGLSLNALLSSVFIVKDNPQLALLDAEFQGDLKTLRLDATERQQLRELYFSKRAQLKSSAFSLSLSLPLGISSLPDKLVEKVLVDILNSWADFADQQKGVMQYSEALSADNFLPKDLLLSEEYLIQADILRSKLLKAMENLELISRIPGSQLIRVGKKKVSLIELKEGLHDLLTVKIEPLVHWLSETNIVRSPTNVKAYMMARLQNSIGKKEQIAVNKAVILDSIQRYAREITQTRGLEKYSTKNGTGEGSTDILMPQIGATFLDRILAMSKSHEKDPFFKDLIEQYMDLGVEHALVISSANHYTQMGKITKGLVKRKVSRGKEERAGQVISSVFKEFRAILDSQELLEARLSNANLNPRVELYTVTGPILISEIRSVSYSYLAIIGLVGFLGTFFLTSLSCFFHSLLIQTRKI